MGVAKCIGHDRVLEGLGLYLKNEFLEEDDDDFLLVMLFENHHSLNVKRTPMKFIQISSMLVDENIALKNNLKLKVKLPQPKSQVENITVKKKLKLKVKLPRARSQLRRLGLLCENKDDGETAFSGLGPTLDYSFLDYSYSSAMDFAADVKLTFSNAMKYNPLTNLVHELAGEFNRTFTLEWKSLEAKWSEEEKSDLVYKDQGLMEISKRKLPPKLHGHLRRLGLLCENKDDGETASEIQIFTSSCFKSNVIGNSAAAYQRPQK
ncbi:hypothetical protein Syun_028441 [Stephania yunnanensis]|uniref:Bromo domain-containing protein n=1 Tax=Stephania yunnanensis TaxID=152371 RepID=A0AAP0EJX0_9MAGN